VVTEQERGPAARHVPAERENEVAQAGQEDPVELVGCGMDQDVGIAQRYAGYALAQMRSAVFKVIGPVEPIQVEHGEAAVESE
jgi:hypothetical protein